MTDNEKITQHINMYLDTLLKKKWDKFENNGGDIIVYNKNTYEWIFIFNAQGNRSDVLYISKNLINEVVDMFDVYEKVTTNVEPHFYNKFTLDVLLEWCERKLDFFPKDYVDFTPQPEEAEKIKTELSGRNNLNEQFSDEGKLISRELMKHYKDNWEFKEGKYVIPSLSTSSAFHISDRTTGEPMFVLIGDTLCYNEKVGDIINHEKPFERWHGNFLMKWLSYSFATNYDIKRSYFTRSKEMYNLVNKYFEESKPIKESELSLLTKKLLG